jgi:hypothetical protein
MTVRIGTTIAQPEADRELAELARGSPYIQPGLGFFFRNDFLTLLRDVETSPASDVVEIDRARMVH